MSNNNSNEYKYVRTLVRDLHVTGNVARPATNGKLLSLKYKSRASKKNPSAKVHVGDADKVPELRKLYRSKLIEADDTGEDDDDDNSERDEGDEGKRSHSVPLMQSKMRKTPDRNAVHRSNCSLNVPSVVVTGPTTDQIDIIASTQRRFSQIYSGLRRFSASHTVREADQSVCVSTPLFFCVGLQ